MSVNTTASEAIDDAKDHLKKAHEQLLVFLNEETWGHDDYKNDYIDDVHEIAGEILKFKRKL